MREGVEVRLRPGDPERLDGVVADRQSPRHHLSRARIVLMTADGAGTMAIRAATGESNPRSGVGRRAPCRAAPMGCSVTPREAALRLPLCQTGGLRLDLLACAGDDRANRPAGHALAVLLPGVELSARGGDVLRPLAQGLANAAIGVQRGVIPQPMCRNLRPPKAGGRPDGRRAAWRAAKRAAARAGD
jgi:hypothetical protein